MIGIFKLHNFSNKIYICVSAYKYWGNKVVEGSFKQPHVLLAEDDPTNQRVAMLMLKRLGYVANVVSNGREAIQAIKRQKYDLVLMNIVMPEIDGLEATREIRKLGYNNLKIIAITAYVFPGAKEMCIAAGMDDYIPKPVRINDLAEMLGKYQHDISGCRRIIPNH